MMYKNYFFPISGLLFYSAISFADPTTPITSLPLSTIQMSTPEQTVTEPIKIYWTDHIQLGGSASLAAFAANKAPTTFGVPNNTTFTSSLILNYADLNITAKPMDGLTGYTDIAYAQTAPAFIHDQPGNGNVLFVEQAFAQFGATPNFPYYLKAGIISLPFGGFNYSSNMESLLQLLSLNGPPTIQIGIEQKQGINGSLYVFQKYKLLHDTDSTNIHDYGASLSYEQVFSNASYRVGAGYVSNILSNFFIGNTTANDSNLQHGFYTHRVPAFDLQALLQYQQFDAALRFIDALSSASVNDVPYTTDNGQTFQGAKLSGWGVNAGYHFNSFSYPSRIVLGYEGTAQAAAVGTASGAENFNDQPAVNIYNTNPTINNFAAIGLPKTRFFGLYKIHTTKWSVVSLELDDYISYPIENGGTDRNALMAMLGVALQYS